ncbi:DUF3574 domain-containing protein [Tenggerimyces flavus]|uniref:DUF3574 domain-containing protein n=1 Tax=Tenggerimyces flavus TaxID=1708749 RepID=A0ABV7YGW4_9ACTN|nr:DUF3574 domain-containing protein [Tenggerimyces flavus]MBM7783912.1 hypothetical protein [Tenggerimyces flavus]
MKNSTVKQSLLPLGLAVAGVASIVGLSAAAAPDAQPDAAPAAASSVSGTQHQPRPGDIFRRTELYFGSARPDNKPPVTDAQFDTFVDKYVTPRFPDGLTQLTGEGQFNGSTGPIEEKSFVVVLLYPLDDRGANKEIEAIRKDYKKAFQQESVLRADSLDRVSF